MPIQLPPVVLDPDDLFRRVAEGDEQAFELLIMPWRAPLFAFLYRLVAHREDAEDLVQEVLLGALEEIRHSAPRPPLPIWLFGLAARAGLVHLEAHRRWRSDAHLTAVQVEDPDPATLRDIEEAIAAPGFQFDAQAHVAFCFTAVGRSLPPLELATLLLREVFGLTEDEAAAALRTTPSQVREHLASARSAMAAAFQPLCSLIQPEGRCNQCLAMPAGMPQARRGRDLWEIAVEPGVEPTMENLLTARLRLVRDAELESGPSRKLHSRFLEGLTHQEDPQW